MKQPAIPVFRQVLPSGLVLLISPNRKIPLVHVNVVVECGTVDNPLDRPGLASLMARMLDEGTSRYTHLQIAEAIENLGGSLTTFSDRELSGVSVSLLSKDIDQGIDLACAVASDPIFPAARLDLEREKVLNQIRSARDNPQVVASNEFNRIIYQGHPLGEPVLGTEASVRKITAAELADFHRRMFAPENAMIAVVGDVAPERCAALLAEKFGDWRNRKYRRSDAAVPASRLEGTMREISMPKEQVNIYLGHLGITRTDPDYYSLQVMDVILGGGPGFTSRIPAKLRDEEGLAYATYSDITGTAGLYPGRFAAFISTSPENRHRAITGLTREIQAIVQNGVTEGELANAQSYLTGSFVFDFQSSGHVARFLLAAEIFQLGFDYMDRYPRIIEAVTRADVNQAAGAHLDPEHLIAVVAGPIGDGRDVSRAQAGVPTGHSLSRI